MKTHEHFIEKCITLARKGILNVSPNPMVGCIIVYNDEIIGEGYHQEYGKSHQCCKSLGYCSSWPLW